MFSIKQRAARTAKRAGLLSGGVVMLAVGTGFLTLAAWFYLSVGYAPIHAALIIAAAYFGVGLVLIGLGKSNVQRDEAPINREPATDPEAPPLMQAFIYGIQAGTKASNSKK